MNVIIRSAFKDEVDILDKMFAKLLDMDRSHDANLKSGLTMQGFFSKRIDDENSIFLVAVADSKIVGYLYGYIQDDNKVKQELESYIESIYIEEEYRTQGIGTMLIEHFELEVKERDVKYIFIDNKVNNIVARNLYSHLNYDLFIESRRKKL